jgi:flagellar L-ring protein precursor FlgH
MVISPLTVAMYDAALYLGHAQAEATELLGLLEREQTSGNAVPPELRAHASTMPRGMTKPAPGRSSGTLAARSILLGLLLILSASPNGFAQAPILTGTAKTGKIAKPLGAAADPAASSLEAYLTRVRSDNKAVQASSGAIWTDAGRLTRMSTDVRAMRPHDLISVVVSESLAASTDGTVKNSRASNASSGISGLIGTLHAGNALQNLVNQNSASGLNAQGTSATNSSLTTTLGGQVVEVLPNGMLVIEAARQVEFSQQVQTIVLRGLVRPEDISQQNQVLSTAISSLELQVRGKGIINDYTHRQNALVRMLQWALVF